MTARATTVDGRRLQGHLAGEAAGRLAFFESGGRSAVRLEEIRRIAFSPQSALLPVSGPPMRLLLPGGETITGELLACDERTVTFKFRGRIVSRIDRRRVAGIVRTGGYRVVLYEDFDSPPSVWDDDGQPVRLDGSQHRSGKSSLAVAAGPQEAEHRIVPPLAAGRVRFYCREAEGSPLAWEVEFVFEPAFVAGDLSPGTDRSSARADKSATKNAGNATRNSPSSTRELSIRLLFGGSGEPIRVRASPSVRLTRQPLQSRLSWRKVALRFDDERLVVLVGGAVLAAGEAIPGRLAGLRLRRGAESHRGRAWIDDLLVTAREERARRMDLRIDPDHTAQSEFRPTDGGNDCLLLADDAELYGTVLHADARRVRIRGSYGERSFEWSRLDGVFFAQRPGRSERPRSGSGVFFRGTGSRRVPETSPSATKKDSRPPPPVTGWNAEIELQSLLEAAGERDVIEAAIEAADRNRIQVRHPVLGALSLAAGEIRRIVPQFRGTRRPLLAETRHLGDGIRSDFSRPVPDGPGLNGEFALKELPRGSVWLAADVADLEAAGPDAPPGTPFLAELRAGHLVTEVLVNGRKAGELNRLIEYRERIGRWQRVRLRIAPRLLRPGGNTWELRQKPSRSNPREYDDFEIRRIALEIESEKQRTTETREP